METQKKILIPGGKTSDLDLVNAAHKMGMYVITSGKDRNAPAHRFADEYVCADYSDKEAMLALAKEYAVDYMCSSANDIAMVSTAYVCEKLGLPGHDPYETTLTIHHKDRFKDLAKQLGLHVPEGEWFEDKKEAFAYALSKKEKLIVKPVDLVGGNGISIAETEEEKRNAIEKAFHDSINKRIVVEHYVEGTSHSLSTFIVDQKIAVYYCDNEYALGTSPYRITTSASPACGFESVKDLLISDTEKIAKELKLVDGRVHVQYIMHDGVPYILEITRRVSGDQYVVPESLSLGIEMPMWLLKAECGMDCHDIPRARQTGRYGRHCVAAPRNGITDGILIDEKLGRFVVKKWLWGERGYIVEDYKKDCLGLLFFQFDAKQDIEDTLFKIGDLITVKYKS